MKGSKHQAISLIVLLVAVAALTVTRHGTPAAPEVPKLSPPDDKPKLIAGYARLPLSLEANRGQADPQVRFLSRGRGYSLFLTTDEAVLSLRAGSQKSKGKALMARGKDLTALGHRPSPASPVAAARSSIRQSSIINGQFPGTESQVTSPGHSAPEAG